MGVLHPSRLKDMDIIELLINRRLADTFLKKYLLKKVKLTVDFLVLLLDNN